MLEHGGGLIAAARRYGIEPDRWLDLSTGIHPVGWPVPAVPPDVWQRLPEENDGLEASAAAYYGSEALLPVAGSQAVIQALPAFRRPSRVGVIAPSYAEHAAAWQAHGHQVVPLDPDSVAEWVEDLDVLCLVNPNNPTGHRWSRSRLLEWHERLVARGGWLVVDEAYGDPTPGLSLIAPEPRPGLVVMRSLGKFFGLAGLRLGFVHAESGMLETLRERLGPWAVSHPARWVGSRALADRQWQAETRDWLAAASRRLTDLLTEAGQPVTGQTPLFAYCEIPAADRLHDALARQGILVRHFAHPSALRFGLPGEEDEWRRLEAALAEAVTEIRG